MHSYRDRAAGDQSVCTAIETEPLEIRVCAQLTETELLEIRVCVQSYRDRAVGEWPVLSL